MRVLSILLIAAALTLSLPCAPGNAKLLQGAIQHAEVLPPLPDQLRPGSVYRSERDASLTVEWFRVPKWLIGQWRSDEIRTISCDETGKGETIKKPIVESMKSHEQFGTQYDNQGNVWSDLMFPRHNRPQEGQGFTLDQTIISGKCMESSNSHVVLFLRTRNVRIDSQTGRIVEAFQGESINSYSPLEGKRVLVEASNRKFDADGNPIVTTVTRNVNNFAGPFVPLPQKHGVDLRQSLSDYLKAHDHADLAPNAE